MYVPQHRRGDAAGELMRGWVRKGIYADVGHRVSFQIFGILH